MNVDCFSREVVQLVKAVCQFHFRCDAGKWDIWNSSLNPFAFFSLLTLYLLLIKCNAWFKHCCARPTYAQCQCLGFNWVRKSHLYYQQPFQNRTYKYQLVRENNFSLSLKQLFKTNWSMFSCLVHEKELFCWPSHLSERRNDAIHMKPPWCHKSLLLELRHTLLLQHLAVISVSDVCRLCSFLGIRLICTCSRSKGLVDRDIS